MEPTLPKKVVDSTFWAFSLRVSQQALSLARLVILARILAPADFGQFGIALLAFVSVEALTQTGFREALIQKKDKIKHYLDTSWTVQAIRGVIICASLFLLAPVISNFFGDPNVTWLVRAIGLVALLKGISNIETVCLERDLDFKRKFRYQIAGTITELVVGVGVALSYPSSWAIMAGYIGAEIARTIMSYVVCSFRPRPRLDRSQINELFGFGKWVFSQHIIVFALLSGDDIVVGRLVGLYALGLYQMAYFIANLPTTEIGLIIAQIAYPAYSRLQDNKEALRHAVLKTMKVNSTIIFFFCGLLIAGAEPLTSLVFGDKWLGMVPALRLLALFCMGRGLNVAISPVFNAIGKPRLLAIVGLFQLAILAMIIFPMTVEHGIEGAAAAIVIPVGFAFLVMAYLLRQEIGLSIRSVIWATGPPAIGASVMMLAITSFEVPEHPAFAFIRLSVIGIFSYSCVIAIFEALGFGLKKDITDLLGAR